MKCKLDIFACGSITPKALDCCFIIGRFLQTQNAINSYSRWEKEYSCSAGASE